MRFAVVSLALCAAASAAPVDTSSVTGLTNVANTDSITGAVPETSELGVRQVDTDSLTDVADIDSITDGVVPDTSDLGVRDLDLDSILNDSDSDSLINVGGALPISTRELNGGEDNFPSKAPANSGLVQDLILEIRHIRFAVVKGIKDELKDIDPSLGQEVSQIINKLNQFERELFRDVDLPGDLYNKLKLVIGEINKVVKSIEGLLINETNVIDPSIGSLISQLTGDINSLGGNLVKSGLLGL